MTMHVNKLGDCRIVTCFPLRRKVAVKVLSSGRLMTVAVRDDVEFVEKPIVEAEVSNDATPV
jgi:hypothetical protein